MMNAKELMHMALLVLQQLDGFSPYDRQEVLHVAASFVAVEVARLNRPKPVRDE